MATNRLNADLKEKLDLCRKELAKEKARVDQIGKDWEGKVLFQKGEAERYREELQGFQNHWKEKIESVGNIIAMYNELRGKADALQQENKTLEGKVNGYCRDDGRVVAGEAGIGGHIGRKIRSYY